MRVVVFGANDLSLQVAEVVHAAAAPVELAGVVHVPTQFRISYREEGLQNTRHRNLAGWATDRGIRELEWAGPDAASDFCRDVGGDIGLAAGWYHMLPGRLRDALPLGVLGVHASLLPVLRGGAPLNWAILAGLPETGLSVFRLEDGVDTGPLFAQVRVPLGPRTTVGELAEWISRTTAEVLRELLPVLAAGAAVPQQQVGAPSYGLMRFPEDGALDWRRPADDLDRLVRAVGRPYPGAFTSWKGRRLLVWEAEPLSDVRVHGAPGQLARLDEAEGVVVVTGAGALELREVTDEAGFDVLHELRRATHQRLDVFPDASR